MSYSDIQPSDFDAYDAATAQSENERLRRQLSQATATIQREGMGQPIADWERFPCEWDDQPEACERARIVAAFTVRFPNSDHRFVEVREHPEGYVLVTLGTLFGSETVQVKSMRAALTLVAHAATGNNKLPAGAVLLAKVQR
jgi:hypothetical protein